MVSWEDIEQKEEKRPQSPRRVWNSGIPTDIALPCLFISEFSAYSKIMDSLTNLARLSGYIQRTLGVTGSNPKGDWPRILSYFPLHQDSYNLSALFLFKLRIGKFLQSKEALSIWSSGPFFVWFHNTNVKIRRYVFHFNYISSREALEVENLFCVSCQSTLRAEKPSNFDSCISGNYHEHCSKM